MTILTSCSKYANKKWILNDSVLYRLHFRSVIFSEHNLTINLHRKCPNGFPVSRRLGVYCHRNHPIQYTRICFSPLNENRHFTEVKSRLLTYSLFRVYSLSVRNFGDSLVRFSLHFVPYGHIGQSIRSTLSPSAQSCVDNVRLIKPTSCWKIIFILYPC